MKRITCVFIIILVCFAAFAAYDENGERSTFLQDISIRLGHGTFTGHCNENGVHVLGGFSFGLDEYTELDLHAITQVMPKPFGDFSLGFEIGRCLLGNRISKKQNSGTGINTIISAGLYASNTNSSGEFLPTYVVLKLTPITAGASYSGRRESLLPVGLAYNFRDNNFSLFFSYIIYDHYIKVSWRDDYR